MKLSIIVPVYNVAEFLGKCLDSLLMQDLPLCDYEIIIVNDGSTDASLSIAENYAEKASNIKIITQVNKGLGGARNTGLASSKGSYTLFVDSDDTLKTNCLKRLIEIAEKDELDFLRFNYQAIREDGSLIQKTKNSLYTTNYSSDVVDGKEFVAKRLGWACYVWVFLYNTSFLKECKVPFEEHLYFEDLDWLPRILTRAKRAASVSEIVYYYLQRPASITQSIDVEKKRKLISDKLGILDKYLQWVENEKDNAGLKKWYAAQITLIVIWTLAYTQSNFKEIMPEILQDFKKRKLYPLLSYRFTWKQKLYVFLINISPRLYLALIRN